MYLKEKSDANIPPKYITLSPDYEVDGACECAVKFKYQGDNGYGEHSYGCNKCGDFISFDPDVMKEYVTQAVLKPSLLK